MKFPDLRFWRRTEEQRVITGLPWDVGGQLPIKPVTTEQALSLVPVFGAVRLLASQISTLPLQTYRKVGDGRQKIPTGSLFSNPAAHGTSYAWLHRCVTSLALRGNAYGLVTARDNMGYPTMIEWLHPDHVQVQDQAMSGPGSYSQPLWYWMGRLVPTEDLVHIAWFTVPYRVKGLSPIEACASVVSTGVSAQVYTADWFNNGAVPPGKMRNTQKTISQPEAAEIKARLTAAIRTRQPIVTGFDWEYDPIAVGANEAKFIETMQLNATQIASIYGIPPEMLGGSTGSSLTYNTVEQNSINFVKFTLRPWLELLEETFSQLLPRPQYVKFNVDALLRGDLATRMTAYRTARDIGLNNLDELRNIEDWAPIPNSEGKDYTPLLVQIAASRGIDAAQAKLGQPLSDTTSESQPPAGQPTGPPVQRSAEDDAGPKDWPSSGDEEPEPRRLLSGAEAAVSLLARRHDPSDPAAMRKFNPNEPRIPGGPHGGEWGAGGGLVHKLLKSLHDSGNHDGAYFSDGDYMDWSSRDKKGVFKFEVGDGHGEHDSVLLDVDPDQLAALHDGLTRSLRDNSDDFVKFGDGEEEFSWEPQDVDGEEWGFTVVDSDGNQVNFDWSRSRMQRLHHALTLTLLQDAIGSPGGEGRAVQLAASLLAVRAAGHDTTPGHDELHHYWTKGPGLAKWAESPTPWTTLRDHLLKYLPPEEATKAASKWFEEVFGFAAGSDLNRVTHGKPPRGKVVGPG